MDVEVIRSAKRRKTAQARLVGDRLEVRIPAHASKAEEQRLVEQFRRRFARSRTSGQIDLTRRARHLARRFDLPEPTEIRWVSNQDHRWGSCTLATRVIRISDRLATAPPWVLDHVLVHELAHLVEGNHGRRFYDLVARNPLAERAEGYLIALSGGVDATTDPFADDVPEPDGAAQPERPVAGPAGAPGQGRAREPEAPAVGSPAPDRARTPRDPGGSSGPTSAPTLF